MNPIKHNKSKLRFEMEVEGDTALLQYEMRGAKLALTHTIVPQEAQGRGLGTSLAEAALEFARESKLEVVPVCPFVVTYIRRNPEYLELVAENQRHKIIDEQQSA